MRRRIGVKKAVIGGAVLAVVALLLLAASGVPPFPGRSSDTSSPDPAGIPPIGPLDDLGAFQASVSPLDLESEDPSAPSVIAVETSPTFLVELNHLDNPAELTRDFEPDESTHDTQGTLVAVLLALTALKASRHQHPDRRPRAVAA